ncbi:MAG: hypothetical protein AB9882_09055 [Ignavibacteriaceae bacterium]
MKIILSRKGFDSANGGIPSPILPDGTLLSIQIPMPNDINRYTNLFYEERSYLQIINELNQTIQFLEDSTCHLDPDIRRSALPDRSVWEPLFGQNQAAQGHLRKNEVQQGDLFRFFGWFKQTEIVEGQYKYCHNAKDRHIIFGYFEISNIFENITSPESLPNNLRYQPHCHNDFLSSPNNALYTSTDRLSIKPELPGANYLHLAPDLVLTKEGFTRSMWNLPEFFRNLTITYHTERSFTNSFFKSANIGQEFVVEENDDVVEWAKKIIINGSN